jgi:hypothetical protein
MSKIEKSVERAIQAVANADNNLAKRREAARAKGTAAAKAALAKAQDGRKSADSMLKSAKVTLREKKADYNAAMAELRRMAKAEEKLLKAALKEEQAVMRKLMSEEKKLLKQLLAPKKKRKPRAKKTPA